MAPPPGSSYVVSNAFSRASRRALGLRDPIRIQFRQGWGPGNPLFQWYEECFKHPDSKMVRAIQLRKERLYPFFHEYIVFICRDGSRYRIDRRQLPDENVPLDSVYSHGVEAYDTVEEISPYHDKLYSTSDCLVEVEFRELDILFIIRICWAIHRHKSARLYTLQRYNCYFFAHTILTCATRSACEWYVSTCTVGYPKTISESRLTSISIVTHRAGMTSFRVRGPRQAVAIRFGLMGLYRASVPLVLRTT
ncbi:hypothetical protein B0J17DRAFT_220539 [Rhizoctonia solani]|nr:hypothetical protein B0J17DRAFT_220539 [Rhizoctonia solani]